MNVTLISDTHEEHWSLLSLMNGNGKFLIHCGDAANSSNAHFNQPKMLDFLQWYNSLGGYEHKIFVPGNHDTSVERGLIDFAEFPNVTVLIHESIVIDGVKLFGSPYTPSFGNGWAYNIARHKIANVWEDIPNDTDILITHGPPKGIQDLTGSGEQVGDAALLNKVWQIKPKIHAFGHIHDEPKIYNQGIKQISNIETKFVNASYVSLQHYPINEPITIEL